MKKRILVQPMHAGMVCGITPRKRISYRWLTAIILAVFVAIALYIRVVLPLDKIFVGDWIKFASNDAYYYMRLVDNLVHNSLRLETFDQYLIFPDGQNVTSFTLFARLLAGISWLIGLGSPTQRIVDMVGVFTPAIMASMVIIPVYFIGKELVGRWVGLISAGLIAVISGEFLGRSILGFTDHHIAEVLFTTVLMLFLLLAVKSTKDKNSTKPVIFSVLAGIVLGVYLLTWIGGLLFIFIIGLYFIIQFTIEHLRRQPTDYLLRTGSVLFLVAMAIFLPTVRQPFYAFIMVGMLLMIWVLAGLSRLFRQIRPSYYLVLVVGVGVAGLIALRLVFPLLFSAMIGVFVSSSTQVTTIEMQPLLMPNGVFTLAVAWGNFGFAIFIAVISLIVLTQIAVKQGDNKYTLIAVWSIAIFVMALGQRRFAYYLAVNVALLTGYLSWLALKWAGLKEWDEYSVKEKKRRRRSPNNAANISIVAVLILLTVFGSTVPSSVSVAKQVQFAPSDAWISSLEWLKDNSPEPLGSGDDYYSLEPTVEPSYGVMAWWDYGYLITRIAHRIPITNPSQISETQVASAIFLTSPEDNVDALGADYVIIDFDTATSKFWAISRYAGGNESDYFGIYYVANGNQISPVQLYYPEYYRTMVVRLYDYNGQAVIPHNIIIMNSEQRTDDRGNEYSMVMDAKQFETYQEAESYLASQQSGNWRIVSNNPFVSPVPLNAVNGYELVYESSQKKTLVISSSTSEISEVKIFRRQ